MIIDVAYAGTTYPFDTEALTLAEAFTVKAICGLAGGAFVAAIFEVDPHAWLAMVVLARRRAGETVTAEDVDHDKLDLMTTAAAALATVQAARKAVSP